MEIPNSQISPLHPDPPQLHSTQNIGEELKSHCIQMFCDTHFMMTGWDRKKFRVNEKLHSTHLFGNSFPVAYQRVHPKGGIGAQRDNIHRNSLKVWKGWTERTFECSALSQCCLWIVFEILSNGELIQREMRDAIRNGNSITTLYCFHLSWAATIFAKPARKPKQFSIHEKRASNSAGAVG